MKEVKARLNFGGGSETSRYSEARIMSTREHERRHRSRRSRSPRPSPSVFSRIRRERSRSLVLHLYWKRISKKRDIKSLKGQNDKPELENRDKDREKSKEQSVGLALADSACLAEVSSRGPACAVLAAPRLSD
ncbi:hypothetical protein Tco_1093583 [Tanacetum coccineum]|uniref:Uncharacterized protein n=1 Tax=Tanacetum coccineum TaxID=301880 RepID=A0ABQ5IDM7_9ASTR